MSFGINVNIPAAGNDPADDQPLIKQNFQNIKDYLTVDHVTPGNAKNGFHKQITYAGKFPPGGEVDPESTAYTNDGIADSTHPQYWWKNSQGIFPLSAIRAFGLINGDNAAPTIVSGFNLVAPVSVATAGGQITFTISVTPLAVFGTTPSLFVSPQIDTPYTSSYALNTITVSFNQNAFSNPTLFSVLLLQI